MSSEHVRLGSVGDITPPLPVVPPDPPGPSADCSLDVDSGLEEHAATISAAITEHFAIDAFFMTTRPPWAW